MEEGKPAISADDLPDEFTLPDDSENRKKELEDRYGKTKGGGVIENGIDTP